MELVRTRLCVSTEGTYRGMWDCVRRTMKYEGLRAFYRGLTPSLVGLQYMPLVTYQLLHEHCAEA